MAAPSGTEHTEIEAQSAALPVTSFEVVVVGRRDVSASSVTTLREEDLRHRGVTTVPDALELIPGVEVFTTPKSGATVQLRGLDERGALILLDGIPVRETYAGHLDLGSMLSGGIASVAVERGVTSVLYGPNSMAGVVNLHSRTDLGDQVGRFRLEGGNPYRQRLLDRGGELTLARRSERWSLFVSGATLQSHGFRLARGWNEIDQVDEYHEDGGLRNGSDFAKSSLTARATTRPAAGWQLSAIVHAFTQDRGIPTFEGAGTIRNWRFTDYDTTLAGLVADYTPAVSTRPGTLVGLKAAAYAAAHTDTIQDYEDSSFTSLTTNPLAWFVASRYRNRSVGVSVTPRLALFSGNQLDLAAAAHYDLARQRERSVPRPGLPSIWAPPREHSALTLNLAIEDTQELGPVRLVAGLGGSGLRLVTERLRGRDYPVADRLLRAADGRLLADWRAADDWHLVISLGRKTRYPTLKELFSNRVGGNPDLEAEQTWMVDAGVDWRGPIRYGRAGVRGFYNALNNLIESRYGAYANVARATTAGGELWAQWAPVTWLELLGTYSYLHARDQTTDRPLDYRSPHSASLDLRLVTPWGSDLAAQLAYRSGQEAFFFDPLTNAWRHDRLPGNALVNLYARHRFVIAAELALGLYLRARNILDSNIVRGSFAPTPGRQLFAGLEAEI